MRLQSGPGALLAMQAVLAEDGAINRTDGQTAADLANDRDQVIIIQSLILRRFAVVKTGERPGVVFTGISLAMTQRARSTLQRHPEPEIDHGRILGQIELVTLASIVPSVQNDRVYRPTDAAEPDLQALAESIRKYGVKEPLVVTLDDVILSGHRRSAAAEIAGLDVVPCRREQIHSTDPDFVPLLREYNRQRAKSIDEVMREEIISADPDDAYANLVQFRHEVGKITVDTGIIRGEKRRAVISPAKRPMMDAITIVLDRLRQYWPVSDRRIHYQLLNAPPLIHASKPASTYINDSKSYKALTELLTRARIIGRIPFEAIHDPTRAINTWRVYRSPGPFIRQEIDGFLKGYYRDLQAPQPHHLEILGEKNTIASIIEPVAADYCIPFTLARGYSSLPPRHEMVKRFERSGKDSLVVLVLSDFDPEGEDIAHSFARSVRDDFFIDSVKFIKVALTSAQVEELRLPPGPTAKKGSSRRKRFVKEHGEHVYELEAVEPERLQTMLRQAIESMMDMTLFREEQDREKQDAVRLQAIRKTMAGALGDLAVGEL